MPKIILTEEQHNTIINHIVNEMVSSSDSINEGAWEKIKYGLSKLGRYKANGKIFGKNKIDQDAAAKIEAIINKKGNEVIAKLDSTIKETNPKFPNNEKGVEFLNTVLAISAVYDSIVASTQKQPNEEGYLPIDAANGIINDLREYVKKFLDVDLTAVYSVVDEIEGNTLELTEEDEMTLDEAWDLSEAKPNNPQQGSFDFDQNNKVDRVGDKGVAQTNKNNAIATNSKGGMQKVGTKPQVISKGSQKQGKTPDIEDADYEMIGNKQQGSGGKNAIGGQSAASSGTAAGGSTPTASGVRSQLQNKRGDGDEFDSERMKTLKSNKLPLILAGIGGALGGLSWISQTDWFKGWLEDMLGGDTTVTSDDVTKQITGGAPDSKGMLHWMGQIDGKEMRTGADVQQFIEKYGADNVKHMFEGNGGGSVDTQIQQLQQLVGGENANKPVEELFNKSNSTYGSMKGGQNLFGISKAASFVANIVVKKGISQVIKGTGTALANSLAGIGAVLGPIGIGLMSAGALVKLMRMKGQKQSRAKTLYDLYQSIRNIDGGAGIIEPNGETIDAKSAQSPEEINKKNASSNGDKGNNVPRGKNAGSDDELYNSLRNLFQFIVNNRKMLGTRSSDNVGTGAAGRKPMNEAKYITDKRMIQFLNKNLSYEKLNAFENLINRVEILRNKIKNINPSDKVLSNHIKGFSNNPIMATDFKQMFNLSADNPKAANSLKAFIDDLFITLYSGKYKFGSMIDKMAGLGGGNINKVDEGDAYDMSNPNKSFAKDAQDRGRFKANLLKFLSNAINLFQYLHKLKKEGKLGQKNQPQSQTQQGQTQQGQPQAQGQQGNQKSTRKGGDNINPLAGYVQHNQMREQIERIKKIMFGNE